MPDSTDDRQETGVSQVPNIALIAVHGVGDPGVDQTGRAIANLLTEFPHKANYSAFETKSLHICTRPVKLPVEEEATRRSFHAFSQMQVKEERFDTGVE